VQVARRVPEESIGLRKENSYELKFKKINKIKNKKIRHHVIQIKDSLALL